MNRHLDGRVLGTMPDDPQPELQSHAAVPKRVDAPPFEVFRCVQCAEVQWVERE
jgi:hypothetical protein